MIPLVFALLLPQEKTVVEGRVVNGITNEPLKKAHVSLNLDGNSSVEVLSGEQGKFRFEGFAPELYQLFAERLGFIGEDGGWIEVAAGEHVEDLVIKMTPHSAIAGHIVDEDGDPVPGARIFVERRVYANGRAYVFDHQQKIADDEGYFFAGGLRAGRYYLTVFPPERTGVHEDLIRTENPVPIELSTGTVLRNAEVRLRQGRVFHIHGRVTNWPSAGIPVELVPTGAYTNPRNNKFEFDSVAPGDYFLKSWSPSCPKAVTVTDHDIDDLVMEFTPGPSITGTIKPRLPEPPIIMLDSGGINVKEDGTFEAARLKPEKYNVDVELPDGYYVKSVQFNHQPSPDHTIDLTSCTGGSVEIVVAPNAASVSVTVRDAKDSKVTLWSESTLRTKGADDGDVTFENLAPGEYRILAWEKVEEKFLEIPDFRARFEAQKITLAEGSRQSVEVKLIPKSVSDAETAKLQ